jgi:subtilase family serine protease
MTMRRTSPALIALLAAAALTVTALALRPGSTAPVHHAGRRPSADLAPRGELPGDLGRRVGATAPARRVQVSLVLHQPGSRALHSYLQQVQQPGSPLYRKFLTPGQVGERFGLSNASLLELRSRLNGLGLRVGSSEPQRTSVMVKGRVEQLRRIFGLRFGDYATRAGARYYAAETKPVVPAALSPYVDGVSDLSNRPDIQPRDIPAGGLKPIDVVKAYDIEPLWKKGIRGQAQTVAILSLGTFDQNDVAQFDREVAKNPTPGPPVESVTVPEHGEMLDASSNNGANGEDALDIQVIRGIAPQAKILNYEAAVNADDEFFPHFADIVHKVVSDGRAKILNISYGICEGNPILGAAERQAIDREVAAALLAGINIYQASGDAGAYECSATHDPSDLSLSIGFPDGSPGVIQVGGTLLSVAADGGYYDEQAWENPFAGGATGGGLTKLYARPSWQTGPGVQNRYSNGRRQEPDVSGPADPASGYVVCQYQSCTNEVGGTSASAPFWAAITALVQQYATKRGAGKLPYLDPLFYKFGRTPDISKLVFHDVTKGNNRFYPATRGWDFATGWGTPDVARLADAIVKQLR